jgi:hypothetical protein
LSYALYCHVFPWCVFFYPTCPVFYYVLFIRIAPTIRCVICFILSCPPLCFILSCLFWLKVTHRTHTIPDRIPCGHDNKKHILYRMGEYIPTVQDKITPRTHKITEHYLDGHDNLKHIAQRIGKRIPNWQDNIKKCSS